MSVELGGAMASVPNPKGNLCDYLPTQARIPDLSLHHRGAEFMSYSLRDALDYPLQSEVLIYACDLYGSRIDRDNSHGYATTLLGRKVGEYTVAEAEIEEVSNLRSIQRFMQYGDSTKSVVDDISDGTAIVSEYAWPNNRMSALDVTNKHEEYQRRIQLLQPGVLPFSLFQGDKERKRQGQAKEAVVGTVDERMVHLELDRLQPASALNGLTLRDLSHHRYNSLLQGYAPVVSFWGTVPTPTHILTQYPDVPVLGHEGNYATVPEVGALYQADRWHISGYDVRLVAAIETELPVGVDKVSQGFKTLLAKPLKA